MLSRGANTKFNSIELLWTKLPTSPGNGNSPITGYKVYWDETGYYMLLAGVNSGDTTVLVTPGVQGKNYNFKVQAFNIYGDGPLSEPFMITPAAEPNAPTNLVVVTQSTTQIKFSWTVPYDGG